jgi:hypothetical protein
MTYSNPLWVKIWSLFYLKDFPFFASTIFYYLIAIISSPLLEDQSSKFSGQLLNSTLSLSQGEFLIEDVHFRARNAT